MSVVVVFVMGVVLRRQRVQRDCVVLTGAGAEIHSGSSTQQGILVMG